MPMTSKRAVGHDLGDDRHDLRGADVEPDDQVLVVLALMLIRSRSASCFAALGVVRLALQLRDAHREAVRVAQVDVLDAARCSARRPCGRTAATKRASRAVDVRRGRARASAPLSSRTCQARARATRCTCTGASPSGASTARTVAVAASRSPRAAALGPANTRQRRRRSRASNTSPCVLTSAVVAPARERHVLLDAHLEPVRPAAAHVDLAHPRQLSKRGAHLGEVEREEIAARARAQRRLAPVAASTCAERRRATRDLAQRERAAGAAARQQHGAERSQRAPRCRAATSATQVQHARALSHMGAPPGSARTGRR